MCSCRRRAARARRSWQRRRNRQIPGVKGVAREAPCPATGSVARSGLGGEIAADHPVQARALRLASTLPCRISFDSTFGEPHSIKSVAHEMIVHLEFDFYHALDFVDLQNLADLLVEEVL